MKVTKTPGYECCACERQKSIDETAWIYCGIFNNTMMELDGFDETRETHGCTVGAAFKIRQKVQAV